MNKTLLKISVGLVAVSLAACAGFFSIVGLSKLFAGAAMAVIIMASTLEASKLVTASFLYQYWSKISNSLKFYLLMAIIIIASITSIGIYGFLSNAYQTTKSIYDLSQTQADSILAKKAYFEMSVASFEKQLDYKKDQLGNLNEILVSQESRSNELVQQKRSSNSADRRAVSTETSIANLNVEINDLNKKILAYTDSVQKQQIASTQIRLRNNITSELGSLSYISKVLNVDMDKVVNVLIILFIIVFDPLAICMVLVFNFLNHSKEIQENSKNSDDIVENTVELPSETHELQSVQEEVVQLPIIEAKEENTPVSESIIEEPKPEAPKPRKDKARGLYSGAVSV